MDSKFCSGNGSAAIDWRAVLDENTRWMRTVLRSRLGDTHAVDDVMQEVAVAVLRPNALPPSQEKVAPWLYRVAVRQAINYRRRHGRQQRLIANLAQRQTESRDSAANPREWVLHKELQESVAQAISELAPCDREILLLKYLEGWTYEQLAQHLGAKIKSIEHRLARARRELRNRLRTIDREEK